MVPIRPKGRVFDVDAPDSPDTKRTKIQLRKDAQRRAFKELLSLKHANGGKHAYGDFAYIVSKYSKCGCEEYVTRKNLEYQYSLYNKGRLVSENPVVPDSINVETNFTDVSTMDTNQFNTEQINVDNTVSELAKGGRKKGSTNAAKDKYLRSIGKATTIAAQRYHNIKLEALSSCTRVSDGTLANVISETEELFMLPPGTLNTTTILYRIRKKNFDGSNRNTTSPLHEIEPFIVDCIIQSYKICHSMTKTDIILLTQEIIAGTIYEEKLINCKEVRKINNKKSLLGDAWFRGFMKRNKDKLKRSRVKVKDNKRHSWCTYENFVNMYDRVYEAMVDAKVAEYCEDKDFMYDIDGNLVTDKESMYGRSTKYRITNPENILFVDETGCNTNQKIDGYAGGELFVIPTDASYGGLTGATTDLHFTVMCFTAGTGHPVMCAIILKTEANIKDIPISWKLGIDIRKNVETGETLYETIKTNKDVLPGGPQCTYNRKTIPCFVGTSPKASITSELLVEMLKTMDDLCLYKRENGSCPFLLLDGHQSRFQLPFLEYINNAANKWMVCVGVPYATHIWQVADSSELNGSFKIALTKAKRDYLKHSSRTEKKKFSPSDIIPLVNIAWKESFALDSKGKKAIIKRGWSPMTYALLDHPELIGKATDPVIINELDASSSGNSNDTLSSTINLSGSKFGSCLDQIISQEIKDDGRRKKYLLEKKKKENNDESYNALKELTKLSSGKLAASNHFCLTNEHILSLALKKKEEDDENQKQKLIRQQEAKAKQEDQFKKSYKKFVCKENLLRDDILVLIRHIKKKDDGPTKKNIVELRAQFESMKGRLELYAINHHVHNAPDKNIDEVKYDPNIFHNEPLDLTCVDPCTSTTQMFEL